MPDAALVTLSVAWAVPIAAVVVAVALLAASLDGVAGARVEGVPARSGMLTPLREGARLLRQRRTTTPAADTLLWRVGSGGLLLVALLMVTVVPLGRWTLLDLDVGVVWLNTLDVTVWALVWLLGWGANSAHSLVGGYRFLALALGYELPLMFALVAPAIAAKSLHLGTIAAAQHGLWYAVWMPAAFLVYCTGVVAFSVWGPFAPALGRDIAGGALTDVASVDRLLVLAGRYMLLVAGSAGAVPLFLGGGSGPLLPGWLWVVVKTAVLAGILVLVRRRLPALRPDLFMEVGWLALLPLVLLQDLIVAVIAVWRV